MENQHRTQYNDDGSQKWKKEEFCKMPSPEK